MREQLFSMLNTLHGTSACNFSFPQLIYISSICGSDIFLSLVFMALQGPSLLYWQLWIWMTTGHVLSHGVSTVTKHAKWSYKSHHKKGLVMYFSWPFLIILLRVYPDVPICCYWLPDLLVRLILSCPSRSVPLNTPQKWRNGDKMNDSSPFFCSQVCLTYFSSVQKGVHHIV